MYLVIKYRFLLEKVETFVYNFAKKLKKMYKINV